MRYNISLRQAHDLAADAKIELKAFHSLLRSHAMSGLITAKAGFWSKGKVAIYQDKDIYSALKHIDISAESASMIKRQFVPDDASIQHFFVNNQYISAWKSRSKISIAQEVDSYLSGNEEILASFWDLSYIDSTRMALIFYYPDQITRWVAEQINFCDEEMNKIFPNNALKPEVPKGRKASIRTPEMKKHVTRFIATNRDLTREGLQNFIEMKLGEPIKPSSFRPWAKELADAQKRKQILL